MSFERSWSRDGVTLCAHEQPGDGPPIVLLHGWCCDRSFLSPQFEHFAALGRHVIALDQRGHGRSGWGRPGVGVRGLADDVAWLVEELDLGRVSVIGHSMGGVVALDLANRRAELVDRVVLLDAIVAVPPELDGIRRGLSLLLDSPRCSETIAEFVRRWLVTGSTAPALVDRVLATMTASPREVAVDCWESLADYDDRGALKACPVPLLFVAAESSVSQLEELPDMNPGLELARIAGVSHFHPLEAPEPTNRLLERFLCT